MSPEDYDVYLFPDEENRSFWSNLLKELLAFYGYQRYIGVALAIIGIPTNLFHMIVLSRKTMRVSSTNIILLGIAINDIMILVCILEIAVSQLSVIWLMKGLDSKCKPPNPYSQYLADRIFSSLSSLCRRTSIWLGVSLAVVRTVVIMNPLNDSISRLSLPKWGWFSNLSVLIFCSPLSVLFFLQYIVAPYRSWIPPAKCGYPENTTEIQYYLAENGWYSERSVIETQQFLDGVISQIIPCFVLPIATVLLVWEVRKQTSKVVGNSSNPKAADRSTKLVLFMTISFLLSAVPVGITKLIEAFVNDSPGLGRITSLISSMFQLFNSFNATIHFLICFFMSSQYRETTKKMFSIQRSQNISRLVAVQAAPESA